ncbi:hypothetical protein MNBD_GAMMA16-866 [hydrothermal vent metagenome]|uniref:Porin domain-containing protein n=1 Tax=hydrothermal vent metagenome TaxID=652676 RepID=A0A3B0Z3R3_9ZZZZ
MRFTKKKNVFVCCLLAMVISTAQAAEFGVLGDDVSLRDSTRDDEARFNLGSLLFHASQKIDDKTTGFVEYIIQSGSHSSSHSDPSMAAYIARLWIKRNITPEFQIGAGQFHSSLGYWTQAYNHGKLTQDTVTRPFFINLRSAKSVFPAHILGLKASGAFNISEGRVSYDLTLANGTSVNTNTSSNPQRLEENFTKKKTAILRTAYHFPVLPIQIGLFGMINPVVESTASDGSASGSGMAFGTKIIDQTVFGFDLNVKIKRFNIIAEYFHITNKDAVGSTGENTASAYYAQLGYWLVKNKLKSIYRYEALEFKEDDLYFQYRNAKEESRHTLALRYDFDVSNALTLEAQRISLEDETIADKTAYYLQWAFMVF